MPDNAMDNPFVAALLMTAAEHRLKAERARSLMDPYPERTRGPLGDAWRGMLKEMNRGLQEEADRYDGLAQVYEDMAKRILGDGYWVRWNFLTKDGYLMGPAELLNPKFEPEAFQVGGEHDYPADWWQRYMWFYRGPDVQYPISFLTGGC